MELRYPFKTFIVENFKAKFMPALIGDFDKTFVVFCTCWAKF